ncbi:16136_t:CDS:1, partial [Racocetra persica]
GTVTPPDTTINGQSTVGNSTYTTDNHGFAFLLTTSNSVAVDNCLLCPSISYLNASLKSDTYTLGFANHNNVDYYLSISLKLSPSVTSPSVTSPSATSPSVTSPSVTSPSPNNTFLT